MGCCIGQGPEVFNPGERKSVRHACTTAVNGFQYAMPWSQPGIVWIGINAPDMKVSGKTQISPPAEAASTVLARHRETSEDQQEERGDNG
jgi:hypothetical protein